mmetsp:Transcript_6047/g.13369  ORF Transcript_6047/g.13369 Transcript_6047/m.13369 type:complete len:522 (+) Transcript_6047:129-1694(+)|eukprot:CAMPEP_0178427828 /NCGR_PEP_ID=MMETSP0689_2-20121128/29948_1 /TAXON_ID=160604 /ORGANISM="Amphidinium massartii, Strain CS-259" /LENGTH=521 /DNA_ID=CAMNT_0020049551 /DNA_START=60 /DNA_END=1625 /DNA_ORIENTATION=+
MAVMRLTALAALLFQLCSYRAWAQMYDFEAAQVPPNRSLHTLYAFYVYSREEAPERKGLPQVIFKNLHAESMNPAIPTSSKTDYKGIQVSIMLYKNFWNLIDPKKFCCTADDDKALCPEADGLLVNRSRDQTEESAGVYLHRVEFLEPDGHTEDETKVIRKTGVYILALSNCGTFEEATISGHLAVKNSYGYLPGNEYHKIPFYGWLLLIYMVLAIVWFFLSLRWWKELFPIQSCISAVVFFGLVESLFWYVFFQDWNTTGKRPRVLFVLAILASVVKSIFSYMLVLVGSLGWGVTRPYLDRNVIFKIQAICFLYIVLDFIRESVLSFRNSHSLSLTFVLLCLLPVSLLNGGIFYWVFTALSNLMETLAERRQSEKLLLFSRLWKILVFAMTVATATLLFQIFNLSRNITDKWRYQWLLTDGIFHVLFLVVLAAMMYLWAPHKYSQRYAYSQQLSLDDKDGDVETQGIWADQGEDIVEEEDDKGESFWAATRKDGPEGSSIKKKGANPEVIGAAEKDTDKI